MALWKDSNTGTRPRPPRPRDRPPARHPREPEKTNVAPLSPETARRAAPAQRADVKESHISSDLTIEGKIVGTGHIRIAGRFKGDVQVDGNVTPGHGRAPRGAREGERRQCRRRAASATSRTPSGSSCSRRGVINGDVKAGSLTVAAGSRMRGQVEFGYEGETRAPRPRPRASGTHERRLSPGRRRARRARVRTARRRSSRA